MSEKTAIEWTDHTFNPWWGCVEVSPACDNCYARTWATFTGHHVWGPAGQTGRRFFGDKHWSEPLSWNRKAAAEGRRRRVFCASMADVFEQNAALDPHRERLWGLIEQTPGLDWLLLTKRPQNIRRMVPAAWLAAPRPNVWYGTTVETQHYADQRVPILLDVPAAVRFLSVEPLLGPVDLRTVRPNYFQRWDVLRGAVYGWADSSVQFDHGKVDWVIVGGESGKGARPMHPDWARSLRDQCQAAGVAFHFKQWGEWLPATVDPEHFESHHQDGTDNAHQGKRDHWWEGVHTNTHPDGPAAGLLSTRVGKRAAGRLLDGRTWDDMPTVATGAAS